MAAKKRTKAKKRNSSSARLSRKAGERDGLFLKRIARAQADLQEQYDQEESRMFGSE